MAGSRGTDSVHRAQRTDHHQVQQPVHTAQRQLSQALRQDLPCGRFRSAYLCCRFLLGHRVQRVSPSSAGFLYVHSQPDQPGTHCPYRHQLRAVHRGHYPRVLRLLFIHLPLSHLPRGDRLEELRRHPAVGILLLLCLCDGFSHGARPFHHVDDAAAHDALHQRYLHAERTPPHHLADCSALCAYRRRIAQQRTEDIPRSPVYQRP